ncbi:FMN-binding negative transcriptional regulator [Paenalkalicoccus suaedae]|uniref:FMN-binding negative transcriptional regulator n=1 Tax=Paenalkalicoccus suaedae TaxID=2592382 RepID=A0A859FCG8_9BACI|nr:FMN-binding negative transcriptional regulator [Paenalkalicoccus suaedae]QKS70471.1 FMN-binding negative transcriptional regulator [Paenalkalicoccus suaedae]
MYIPTYYKVTDEKTMYEIIQENSFATLFSQSDKIPHATHLPLLLNYEKTHLYGHFARPNPQWQEIMDQTVLAVFHGPPCYISPSWYETNQTVPTWNYVTAHVYGKVKLVHDEQELRDSLSQLVEYYESPDSGYTLNDMEEKFVAGLSKGVQGFRMTITKIEAKAKLSQNHSEERRELVVKELEKVPHTNEQQIASLMKKYLNKEMDPK